MQPVWQGLPGQGRGPGKDRVAHAVRAFAVADHGLAERLRPVDEFDMPFPNTGRDTEPVRLLLDRPRQRQAMAARRIDRMQEWFGVEAGDRLRARDVRRAEADKQR